MKLTEGKIKEAQEVIEALMEECGYDRITIDLLFGGTVTGYDVKSILNRNEAVTLADLYINRLHELNGTQAPLF